MSQLPGSLEDASELEGSSSILGRWYHIPVIVLLLAFTLWNRVRNWSRFVVDGQVLFSGNDPWYHLRTVRYTVHNWPQTIPFDPFTRFPVGAHSSQFGTIFDQIIATATLVVGFGSPDQQTIAMVLLFAPAVFGTALAIPIYVIARRLGGRVAGLVGVAVVVLSTGSALRRGMVGFADHQIAEALFQALAVLGVMVAVSVAEREKPVYELFANREFDALRRPLGWGIVAGVGLAAYIWSWPPGVLLIGILGAYFTIELASEYVHGESPEHVGFVGATTFTVGGVLMLASLETLSVSPTAFSVLQPGLAFAGAVWIGFLAWISREWDARDVDRRLYPAGVVGILAAIAVLTMVLLPDLFDFFVNQTTRVIGFSTSPTAGTVGEAQPLRDPAVLYQRYGLAVVLAIGGAAFVLLRHLTSARPRAEQTLVAVWLPFILAATFTQARFDYYLLAPIAAMTAYVVGLVLKYADLTTTIDDVEVYHVLTVLAIVLVLFAPLVVGQPTAMTYGDTAAPGGSIQAWEGSLDWMNDATPEPGQFGGANNSLDYDGTYAMQDDFEYPAGSYGVLSWWDYGHWITVLGERIPIANPFQHGANEAANFLLAPDEAQADRVLERLSEGPESPTRYVMADWKMVTTLGGNNFGGKFFAPPAFYREGDVSRTDYYRPIYQSTGERVGLAFYRHTQDYYNTTVVRLYKYHGSAVEPSPYVVDWERQTSEGRSFPSTPSEGRAIKAFDNMTAARQYVDQDGTAQVGGVGPYPSERVPALEHYRLVQGSNQSAFSSRQYSNTLIKTLQGAGLQPSQQTFGFLTRNSPSWVKVFEHVPGATVEGQGPPNSEVVASVEMRNPNANSTFTYRQFATTDANGEFTMTVPYSTTGYAQWGPEDGYTSPSVRATGEYTFQTQPRTNESLTVYRYSGSAAVTEGQVIGEDDSDVDVDLEREVVAQPEGAQAGNESAQSDAETIP